MEDVVDPIAVIAGLVQTALYLDFFYVYFTKYALHYSCSLKPSFSDIALMCRVLQGQKFELPA